MKSLFFSLLISFSASSIGHANFEMGTHHDSYPYAEEVVEEDGVVLYGIIWTSAQLATRCWAHPGCRAAAVRAVEGIGYGIIGNWIWDQVNED